MIDKNSASDAQRVAEMEANIGREHVGAVYAEAFLAVAEKARATDVLLDVFDMIVSDILDPFPEFERILDSALISHERRMRKANGSGSLLRIARA